MIGHCKTNKTEMNIGAAIKHYRQQTNISQGLMAQKLDITQTYLSLVESGKKDMSLPKLKVVCDIFEIPLWLLIMRATQINDIYHTKQKIYKQVIPAIIGMADGYFLK